MLDRIDAGILPVKLLSDKFKYVRLESEPICVGRLLVNLLPRKSNTFNFVKLPISGGILPINVGVLVFKDVFVIVKVVKLVRSPIPGGIWPS